MNKTIAEFLNGNTYSIRYAFNGDIAYKCNEEVRKYIINQNKEIERLNNELEQQNIETGREIERLKEELRISKMSDKDTYETSQEIMAEQSKEIERLNNIIKEVREYIYNKEINTLHFNCKDFLDTSIAGELLEILDKVEEK